MHRRTLAGSRRKCSAVLLEGKNAVVYGGSGMIGSAVARGFAREGATVHLAGRTLDALETVAEGIPLAEMALADFEQPIHVALRSTFLTARAAARHMIRQGSGVMFGGSGDPMRDYSIGGYQIALTAVDALGGQLAAELGPHGIRAVTLLTGGVVDAIPLDFEGGDAIIEGIVGQTMLGRAATLQDVADVAAFVASDRGRTLTATAVNISAGAIVH